MNMKKPMARSVTSKALKVLLAAVVLLALVGSLLFFLKPHTFSPGDDEKLYVAVVGPMSGKDRSSGEQMLSGIQLALSEINSKEELDGKTVELVIFDDQNDPYLARQKALEIHEHPKILMVIGHDTSESSFKGGDIYRVAGIPAITASATAEGITEDSEWYYRIISTNPFQGRFLAYYVREILDRKTAGIVYDQRVYGASLARAFQRSFEDLGGRTLAKWGVDGIAADVAHRLDSIATEIVGSGMDDSDLLFLAMHAAEAAELVVSLKRKGFGATLLGGDAIGDNTFAAKFREHPEEKSIPGYFSNGIYAPSPIIFDVAGEKAQRFRKEFFETYGLEPTWKASNYYDAMFVAAQALKSAKVKGHQDRLATERQNIRQALAGFSRREEAIHGVSGAIYFDSSGNVTRPLTVGVFEQQQFISALTQIQPMTDLNHIAEVNKTGPTDADTLRMGDTFFYKSQVVYTGIEVHQVSDLDLENLTHTLDFSIWFRYKGQFDTHQIEFLNAVGPVDLGTPLQESMHGDMNYRRYRTQGRFAIDFWLGLVEFGQHVLGISFRHRDLTRNRLIYVRDDVGLNLLEQTTPPTETARYPMLSAKYGRVVTQTVYFSDIAREKSFGSPNHLAEPGGIIEFSRFNVAMPIKEDRVSLREVLPASAGYVLLGLSIILLLVLAMFSHRCKRIVYRKRSTGSGDRPFFDGTGKADRMRFYLKILWVLQTAGALLFLLSAEMVFINSLENVLSFSRLERNLLLFELLWWIVPAVLVKIALERFVWLPLEYHTGRTIPDLVRYMTTFLIYLLALFGIVAFVFDLKLTGLLATSGVFAMIIGLAIQMNISNLFAGIALNVERPFRVGDWVRIGEQEGQVVDMTWRTTRIQTLYETLISIPNSTAADSNILNYSFPDDPYWTTVRVSIAPFYDPARVQQILLDAALAVPEILHDPAPLTRFKGQGDSSANFDVWFCVENYGRRSKATAAVWTSIWTSLEHAGIKRTVLRREILRVEGTETIVSREKKALPDV